MKLRTVQIVWHEREPVLSLDFHPGGWLATAGSDKTVKVTDFLKGSRGVEFIADLTGHISSVNCVRFSPSGTYLASGGDCGELVLWKRADGGDGIANEKSWVRAGLLRGHSEDIHDICWSQDSSALISGAVEGTAIVWDIAAKRGKVRLSNHKHYVQGVAWDPANEYIITQGADRSCRVYSCVGFERTVSSSKAADTSSQWMLEQTIFKRRVQGPNGLESNECLFHDDTLPSFFRRLAWSPDGSFVVVPSGISKTDESHTPENCAFIFARGRWGAPAMQLTGLSEPFLCVRFCPVLFHLPSDGNKENEGQESCSETSISLPYRVVYAAATITSVLLYASEDPVPLAIMGGLHCAAITDLAWSDDGAVLAISSRDGYCSFVRFEDGELGRALDQETLTSPGRDWLKSLETLRTAAKQETKGVSKLSSLQDACTESTSVVPERNTVLQKPKVSKRITPVIDLAEDSCQQGGDNSKDPICIDVDNDYNMLSAVVEPRSEATRVPLYTAKDHKPLQRSLQDVEPKKKKRRIVPVAETENAGNSTSTAGMKNDTFSRIEKSAGLIFGRGKSMKPAMMGLFGELNKLAAISTQDGSKNADEDCGSKMVTEETPAREANDAETTSGLGGLAGLLHGSRFS